MDVYEKLSEMGITFAPVAPLGLYKTAIAFGDNLMFTSGHNGRVGDSLPFHGKVGWDVTLVQGVQSARQAAINLLSSIHAATGDLNRVKQVVKMTGYVASAENFYYQPKILDGASQLLVEVFGPERGTGVRSAIGVNVLSNNQPVVIELLVELYPAG